MEEKKEKSPIELLDPQMKEALSRAIEEVSSEELAEEGREDKKKGEEIVPEVLRSLLDIPLEISVELGRTKMLIGDLLQVTQGSTIELDKFENEPVEILVNGRHIARGEVILIGDRFGIRIIDIISPEERIKRLGKI